MASYVALATVTAELPTGHGLADATVNGYISDASAEVDELAGNRFPLAYNSDAQKFPEITGTPATPKTIEQCALWLALSYCFAALQKANRYMDDNNPPNKVYYRDLAEAKLEKVAAGEIDLNIAVQSVLYADDKYPDDETDRDRVFTADAMDAHLY